MWAWRSRHCDAVMRLRRRELLGVSRRRGAVPDGRSGWQSLAAISGRDPQSARVPASMEEEGAGPKSPFWPRRPIPTSTASSRRTSSWIPSCAASATRTSTSSGRARCTTSRRFNNQFYRKSIEYMQEIVGTKPGRSGAPGCHDHAVFFNGRFERPIKEQMRHAGSAGRPGLRLVPLHRARGWHRWATAASPSSIRRCTTWRRASNPVHPRRSTAFSRISIRSRTARRS